jgi:hypothetical protein
MESSNARPFLWIKLWLVGIYYSGYEEPKDLDHMTSHEIVAHQLNFRAKMVLWKNMLDEIYIRTSLCNTAKEIWDIKKIHEREMKTLRVSTLRS